MKKATGKQILPDPYRCRKCLREDFKKLMEFTKHLKKCKGPAVPATLPQSAPASKVKQLPLWDLLSLLREVSNKAGDLKSAVDQVIKRLK